MYIPGGCGYGCNCGGQDYHSIDEMMPQASYNSSTYNTSTDSETGSNYMDAGMSYSSPGKKEDIHVIGESYEKNLQDDAPAKNDEPETDMENQETENSENQNPGKLIDDIVFEIESDSREE